MISAIAAGSRTRIPVLAVALALGAAPAQAELDPEKLAASGQTILNNYVRQSEGALQPRGPVTAVRDGDAVVITVPAVSIVGPKATLDVQPSFLRLEEEDGDHVVFSATLAETAKGRTIGEDPQDITIRIGGHRFEGVYRPSLLTFERADLLLEQLVVDVGDAGATLLALRASAAARPNSGEKWRIESTVGLDDLQIRGPVGKPVFSVGHFEQSWWVDEYDLPALAAFQRELTGEENAFVAMSEPDRAKATALSQAYLDKLPELLAGASGGFAMRLADAQANPPGKPSATLAGASLDFTLAPEGEFYGVQLSLGLDEPRPDPNLASMTGGLLLRRARVDAGLRRIPLAPLWQMVAGPMREAMLRESEDGELSEEAEAEFGAQMAMIPITALGLAAGAGSFAEFKSIEIEFGPARLTAKGRGPLMPGIAEPPLRVEATIEGLEALVDEVQNLDPAVREKAMPALVALRGLGEAAERDGKVVHTYLIEQNEQGSITVNGVAMSDLRKPPK